MEETFPKKKLIFSEAKARAILSYKGPLGTAVLGWLERWLDQWVRERSLPPQLAQKDFLARLGDFLAPPDAIAVLERLRADFRTAYPQLFTVEAPNLSFLEE